MFAVRFRNACRNVNARPFSLSVPKSQAALPAFRYGRSFGRGHLRTAFQSSAGPKSAIPTRYKSSTAEQPVQEELDSEAYDHEEESFGISSEEFNLLARRASEVFPSPPHIPPGWSSDWSSWPLLATLFWYSPYYLHLPQIELLVNIRYKLRGEVQAVLWHTDTNSFVLRLIPEGQEEGEGLYYLVDSTTLAMFAFPAHYTVDDILAHLSVSPTFSSEGLEELEQDPRGIHAINLLLARDKSVIPLLRDEFLNYEPEDTDLPEEEQQRLLAERLESGLEEDRGLRDLANALRGALENGEDKELAESIEKIEALEEEEEESQRIAEMVAEEGEVAQIQNAIEGSEDKEGDVDEISAELRRLLEETSNEDASESMPEEWEGKEDHRRELIEVEREATRLLNKRFAKLGNPSPAATDEASAEEAEEEEAEEGTSEADLAELVELLGQAERRLQQMEEMEEEMEQALKAAKSGQDTSA